MVIIIRSTAVYEKVPEPHTPYWIYVTKYNKTMPVEQEKDLEAVLPHAW